MPVPLTPFTMKMSFGAELSLPYFMQAEASGKFSYSVDVSGMEVGIQVAGGRVQCCTDRSAGTIDALFGRQIGGTRSSRARRDRERSS